MMEYVIGLDGGGTKTVAVIADQTGKIITEATGGTTNPNTLNQKELTTNIKRIFDLLKEQAPEAYRQVTYIYAGMSGVGTSKQKLIVSSIFKEILKISVPFEIVSDTMNALFSGTYGKPGIVQIAGTGSITYGINAKGFELRLGGWGYLFGDEGSGYDLGRRAIVSVLEFEEKRNEKTELKDLLLSHFNVKNGREMIEKIYKSSVPKKEIAPLSIYVFKAYKNEDRVAVKIVHDVAEQLTANVMTVNKELFSQQEVTPVILAGGVFSEKEILPLLIKRKLENSNNISVCLPEVPPVYGSVIGALKNKGITVNEEVLKNIKTIK